MKATCEYDSCFDLHTELMHYRPTEGHYTAVVNTPGGWYNFNDHRVAKLTTENVEKKHQNGVMFFLKRVA